ncbi:MAG: ABC transporter ATP-binding protein [Pseudomonadota bacterium]
MTPASADAFPVSSSGDQTCASAASEPAPGSMIALANVVFRWPGADTFTLRIDQLEVARGARVLLTGPSGTGKTTLLNLLSGISAPQQGQVVIDGTDLTALSSSARDRFRAERLGVIFQMFNLLPYGSARDNVVLGLSFAPERRARVKAASKQSAGAAPDMAEASRLLSALGLADEHHRASAASLSIGQQQRVAAARALIGQPALIIADEPTSALDAANAGRFLDLLFEQAALSGSTLVMVSHDTSLAPRFDTTLSLADVIAREGGAPFTAASAAPSAAAPAPAKETAP